MLIVCYSISNGNTLRIAEMLQKKTGADLVRLDTVTPYPNDYNTVVDQGQREVNRGYEPAIKPLNVSLDDYDVIAVGTPTWWYTMAPAVLTFLQRPAPESVDSSGFRLTAPELPSPADLRT